jgi:hypothetical protein
MTIGHPHLEATGGHLAREPSRLQRSTDDGWMMLVSEIEQGQ